jgi:hypothetical protein
VAGFASRVKSVVVQLQPTDLSQTEPSPCPFSCLAGHLSRDSQAPRTERTLWRIAGCKLAASGAGRSPAALEIAIAARMLLRPDLPNIPVCRSTSGWDVCWKVYGLHARSGAASRQLGWAVESRESCPWPDPMPGGWTSDLDWRVLTSKPRTRGALRRLAADVARRPNVGKTMEASPGDRPSGRARRQCIDRCHVFDSGP